MRKLIAVALIGAAALIPALALAADAAETDARAIAGVKRAAGIETEAVTSVARRKAHAFRQTARRENRHREARRRARAEAGSTASPALEAIAACESGGNPQAIGGGGAFRGKYQFDTSTWASVGGSGDPAAAPEAEQDRRAAMLYARSGATPWPVCGQ